VAGTIIADVIQSDQSYPSSINIASPVIISNTFAFPAGTVSAPAFFPTGDTNTGIFFPAADTIAFAEGGAEAMRITSNGSVLIGGTTDTAQTSGFLVIQRTSTPGLDLFRNETAIVDTSVLGQIRFLGNDTTSNTPAQLAYIRATASGTHSAGDNPTDLVFATTPDNTASVAEAGRISQSGAYILKGGTLNPGGIGITFPATQSASSNANTLDDYEEGTWTPVIADAASGGNTATLSSATGNYTKIGNLVRVQGRIQMSSKGSMTSGNNVHVRGLPFVSANNNTNRSVGSMLAENCTFSGFLVSAGNANESHLIFQQTASNTASISLTVANITDSFFVIFDIVYQTA
jgi:hypothetical protein